MAYMKVSFEFFIFHLISPSPFPLPSGERVRKKG